MNFWLWALLIVVAIAIILSVIFAIAEAQFQSEYKNSKWSKIGKNPSPTPPEPSLEYGIPNPEIFCSNCQTKGYVSVKAVTRKKGISGGKASAALLTGGATLVVTGLSRKEQETQMHCKKCNTTWFV